MFISSVLDAFPELASDMLADLKSLFAFKKQGHTATVKQVKNNCSWRKKVVPRLIMYHNFRIKSY